MQTKCVFAKGHLWIATLNPFRSHLVKLSMHYKKSNLHKSHFKMIVVFVEGTITTHRFSLISLYGMQLQGSLF